VAAFSIDAATPGRLVASGELSFETATEALRKGDQLLRQGGDWVVDLSRIDSGDSAGVAVLVEWLATARAKGIAVHYEGIPAQMLAIARISDLEDLLVTR
jgi:phospholipid transport system transporter-binding protein